MSSAETATEPGVSATCTIIEDSLVWKECTALPGNTEEVNGSVWALPLPSATYGLNSFSLQHRFFNANVSPFPFWNVMGNTSVNYLQTEQPVDFTFHALSVSETWSWSS